MGEITLLDFKELEYFVTVAKYKNITKASQELYISQPSLSKYIKKLEDIAKYQGILCDTSDNLFNCYKLYEQALEKFEKVYAYGMLTYHLDMSNQEGIKNYTIGTAANLKKLSTLNI